MKLFDLNLFAQIMLMCI